MTAKTNAGYSAHDKRTDAHLAKIEKKVDKVQATLEAHRKEEKTNGERITKLENTVRDGFAEVLRRLSA